VTWGDGEAPVFSPESPEIGSRPALSKFRGVRKALRTEPAEEADEGEGDPGKAAVGRLKLVKRGNIETQRKSWLRRVLSSL